MSEQQKLALSPEAAAKQIGIGRTKIYEEIKSGRLRAKKCGKKTIIASEDLHSYLRNLPDRYNDADVAA